MTKTKAVSFNGKTVITGKQRRLREPDYFLYKLVGASPPVTVEERTTHKGKTTFYVQASITKKTVLGRVLKSGRRTRPRYFRARYSGFGTTLPQALQKLEKNMATEFKALAQTLGYELEG